MRRSTMKRSGGKSVQDVDKTVCGGLSRYFGAKRSTTIDPVRYRKIRRFFFGALFQIVVFDLFFSLPLLRWIKPSTILRWEKLARRYNVLATEMGGVLIKLGQFISTRVDLLPPEVIHALVGLQDKVPPADIEKIIHQVEADFSRPLAEIFPVFASLPLGSASLAQAHGAELPDGTQVVVKVLRPGIDVLVATDLMVMGQVCRWLNRWMQVRKRMNLDQLMDEFATTTNNELDMTVELSNLKQFAADLADDPDVYVPRPYDSFCREKTLTMENVAFVRIGDTQTMKAWGIRRQLVADRLYDLYMKQIFVTNFIHVDPHPGNLFVRPLPHEEEIDAGIVNFATDDPPVFTSNRKFQIVFIDFGMTAVVANRIKAAIRVLAIGVGTRDARKVVQAYAIAGALKPGMDTIRLEAAHEDLFNRLWGLRMGKIHKVAFTEVQHFFTEYRDIIAQTPFQLQAEMLFVGRAIGILAGMATQLDPEFDPWEKTIPYARKFAQEELRLDWKALPGDLLAFGRYIFEIPGALHQVLDKAKHGALAIQVSLSPETRRAIKRIDLSLKRFTWMALSAGLLFSGVNLFIAQYTRLGMSFMVLSAMVFLWGMRKG